MNDNPSRMWTSVEVHSLYLNKVDDNSDTLSRLQLITEFTTHLENSLVVMNIDSCASLLCFREYVPKNLPLVKLDESDKDAILDKLINKIMKVKKSHLCKTKKVFIIQVVSLQKK